MSELISQEVVEKRIYLIRARKVMIDRDLAELYGVETRVLNQALKRNIKRFPMDFMFALTREEIMNLSQTVISSKIKHAPNAYAFTEQGVAMLSCVLKSDRAVQVNIEIMRTFVRLRQILSSNTLLARKVKALEKKYDEQFKVVFEAIYNLMNFSEKKTKKQIGFNR